MKFLIINILIAVVLSSNLIADEFDVFMKMNKKKYPHEITDKNLDRDSIWIEFFFVKVNAYFSAEPDSAVYYLNEIESMISSKNKKYFLPRYYMHTANYYLYQNNQQNAIDYYLESLKYLEDYPNDITKSMVLTNLSVVYRGLEDFEKFLEYSYKAIELNEQVNMPYGNVLLWNDITKYFIENDNYSDAEIAAKNMLKTANKTHNFIWDARAQNFYFNYLLNTKQYSEAEKIAGGLAVLADTLYYNNISIDIYENLAKYYIIKEDKVNALKYSRLADETRSYDRTLEQYYSIKLTLARAEMLGNRSRNALEIVKNLIHKDTANIPIGLKIDAVNEIIKIYKSENDIYNQLYYTNILIELKDNFNKLKRTELVGKYEVQLKTREKEIQLNKAIALQKASEAKLFVFIIVSLALLIIIIIFYLRYFYKQKQLKAQIHIEQEKAKFEKKKLEEVLSEKSKSIIEKQDLLDKLEEQIQGLTKENINLKSLESIVTNLNKEDLKEKGREEFEFKFTELYPNFYSELRQLSSELSPAELRICSFIKMNYSSKDIASMLNISSGSVDNHRSKIRKKLNLEKESNIYQFIQNI